MHVYLISVRQESERQIYLLTYLLRYVTLDVGVVSIASESYDEKDSLYSYSDIIGYNHLMTSVFERGLGWTPVFLENSNTCCHTHTHGHRHTRNVLSCLAQLYRPIKAMLTDRPITFLISKRCRYTYRMIKVTNQLRSLSFCVIFPQRIATVRSLHGDDLDPSTDCRFIYRLSQ